MRQISSRSRPRPSSAASKSTPQAPKFGAHLSVAGGLHNACTAATAVGCDCLQIFVKNQRQWRAPKLNNEQISLFHAAAAQAGVAPIVAHASYLLNLAAPGGAIRSASIAAMIDELERCEALGVSSLIFHPGAHLGEGLDVGIARIAAALDEVTRATAGFRTMILLEITAGQGTAIGFRFEQLAAIRAALAQPERTGVCLDTCHLFAAGYDFRTPAGYAGMMDELDSAIGLAHMRCIHVNDSKKELGSRVDRHEHIGKGKIGRTGFANFVNDPRWAGMAMVLETPKGVDGRGTDLDKVNLKRLRGMVGS